MDSLCWAWSAPFCRRALLVWILRLYGLGPALSWGLLAIWVANPIGPFRFSPFFPAFSDPLAFVFFFALFVGYKLRQELTPGTTFALCALGFVGAFVREIMLLVPLTFLGAFLIRNLRQRGPWLGPQLGLHLLPIASVAIGIAMTRGLVDVPMGEYTTLGHAQKIWARNGQFPEILPLALMTALGPFVLWQLASLRCAPVRRFLGEHPELPIYLLGMLALSVSGGNHTDRFVSWMLVAALPWLGFLLQKRVAWPRTRVIAITFFSILLAAQALTYRMFHGIPTQDLDSLNFPGEPGFRLLAPYGEGVTFGQTLAAFMTRENRLPLLGQFTLLGLVLLALGLWDRRKQRGQPVEPSPSSGPPWIEP